MSATPASQFAAAHTDSATPRIRLGNISPSSTHTTGPHDTANATTNRFAPISVTGPHTPSSWGAPSTMRAVEKPMLTITRLTNMPTEPVSSSLRRPTRSMRTIATTVAATLMKELSTDSPNAADSSKPTDSHNEVE